jgi:hypothetical protein
MSTTPGRYLTSAQAAAIVGVSREQFLRLAKAARITHSAQVGKSLLWTKTAALAVWKARKPLGRPRKEATDGEV